MINLRPFRQLRSASFAIVTAFVFFAASNYCNVEALIPHACHGEAADHHEMAAAEHDHDAHDEQPAHHHDETASACCKTIQAVVATPAQLSLHTVWLAHALPTESLWTGSLVESLRLASGLSPPSREPPSKLPFYRTVFASHAPPISSPRRTL